jgi:hypothetical protein
MVHTVVGGIGERTLVYRTKHRKGNSMIVL